MLPQKLPPAFENVAIPSLFAPSAIGAAGGCRLKLVLKTSSPPFSRMEPGPLAEIGTLSHLVPKQHSVIGGDPSRVFELCFRRAKKRLRKNPVTAVYADLDTVVGAAEWSRIREQAINRCNKILPQKHARNFQRLASSTRETSLADASLRLRGRADLIKRNRDRVEIWDYKAGRIHGVDMEVKAQIKLQLWCYGLIELASNPHAKIRLFADNGLQFEIPFDEKDQKQAKAELRRLMRRSGTG